MIRAGSSAVGLDRREAVGGLRQLDIEVEMAGSADDEDAPELGQGVADRLDLAEVLAIGDQRRRAAVLEPVLQRVRPELREQRQRDRAHLVDGEMRDHGLRPLRQQDSDPFLLPDAVATQHVGEPVRAALQLVEADRAMPASWSS